MSEWQPIETMPDGSPPVLLIAPYPLQTRDTVWSDIYHGWRDRNGDWARWPHSFEPTHWMTLPEPPKRPMTRADYDAAPEDGTRYR